jgi:hypothetical protein
MIPTKYPKTLHFPWSPGLQNDDRMLQDTSCFDGKYVVMTEKMDGENTTLYRDSIHARSVLDMAPHPSRTWVKALHGQIKNDIPEGWRICGENLFAKHSIHYHCLRSYFYVFSIWDGDVCLAWRDTLTWCDLLGLATVPFIWDGRYSEQKIHVEWENYKKYDMDSHNTDEVEGYVVRNGLSFDLDNFQTNVAKYVRKNHVQTSEHWLTQPMVKNVLQSYSN